jgi:hypothetical protein
MNSANPAGRLYDLLEAARLMSPNEAAVAGWAKVFGVGPRDQFAVLSYGSEVWGLARQVRSRVEELIDDDPETVLEYFGEVETTVANFGALASLQMGQFMAPLRDTGRHCLKLCASLLKRRDAEPAIADSEVARLLQEVRDLVDEVRRSELDSATRRWIMTRLLDVETALAGYDVTGFGGVESATDSLVGGLRRGESLFERLAKSSVFRGVVALVVSLDLALNSAANLQAITGNATEDVGPSRVVVEIAGPIVVEPNLPEEAPADDPPPKAITGGNGPR